MPITKQAVKKLRHDRVRAAQNKKTLESLRRLTKSMRQKPSKKTFSSVTALLDKAAKRHVIHTNKASRLKSRLSKLLSR